MLSRYDKRMRLTEERMRALGLLTPSCVLTLDEWEIPRDRVVINRKLGEGAFGTVYGGEAFFDEKGWVSCKGLIISCYCKDKLRENECAILSYLFLLFSRGLTVKIGTPLVRAKF